ncbi:MAG: hypothetical protein RJQ14_05170, partial [Marinoscillum sp.]
KGIPKPFSGYGAAISSNVYLEFDSIAQKYFAYAGQNNQQSWRKMEDLDGYGLNHEQYHFNITEFYARELNRFITENPSASTEQLKNKHDALRNELRVMQEMYDDETDHSLNQDIQRLWEFRIDTLLDSFDSSNTFVDRFSKLKLKIPFDLNYSDSISQNEAFRIFEGYKYDIKFKITVSLGSGALHFPNFKRAIMSYPGVEIIDSTKRKFQALSHSYDSTTNTIHYDLISFNGYHIVDFRMAFKRRAQSHGYEQIVNSVLSSIRFDKSNYSLMFSEEYPHPIEGFRNDENAKYKPGMVCYVNNADSVKGFYGIPFMNTSNDVIIPFKILNHNVEEINETMVIYGNENIVSITDSLNTYLIIPSDIVNPNQNILLVGFTLKKDTTQGCFQYYCQMVELEDFFYTNQGFQ